MKCTTGLQLEMSLSCLWTLYHVHHVMHGTGWGDRFVRVLQTMRMHSFRFPCENYQIIKTLNHIGGIPIPCQRQTSGKFCQTLEISMCRMNTPQWSTPNLPDLRWGFFRAKYLNTLKSKQNSRHFPDDVFKCIFLNGNVWISIKISLKLLL